MVKLLSLQSALLYDIARYREENQSLSLKVAEGRKEREELLSDLQVMGTTVEQSRMLQHQAEVAHRRAEEKLKRAQNEMVALRGHLSEENGERDAMVTRVQQTAGQVGFFLLCGLFLFPLPS